MYSILITFGVLLIVAIFRWMLSGEKKNSDNKVSKIFISFKKCRILVTMQEERDSKGGGSNNPNK